MSAVTVALIVGFVCCALFIRALGERRAEGQAQALLEDGDRIRRAADPGAFDA
ncbi:hypothetical protein [Nocardia brasiliensis]|uniref:hypothetical protein n=1 Tax=Nocardia brasiliensis TaxID=37326 RepID=UPI003672675A